MKQKVTVFGSFVVDLMTRSPRLPVAGETVKGSFFKQGAGGKGFNQGIAAHKAGADVAMITKLGRDSLSRIALVSSLCSFTSCSRVSSSFRYSIR